jgi:protein gp37
MASRIAIQYADDTCNLVMGCDGCQLWSSERKTCYAGVEHETHGGRRPGYSPTFNQITLWPDHMAKAACLPDLCETRRNEKPWLDGSPRLISISDMGDALCGSVTFDFLRQQIIDIVTSHHGRRHCWLWLTTRSGRMGEFSQWLGSEGVSWPANLWAGTSVSTTENTRRIDELLRVGDHKTLHFVNVEPQLEPLDLRPWLPRLDWVIQGGEFGQQARKFDVTWAQEMRRHCQEARVPYFLKQLGAYVFRGEERIRLGDRKYGADWSEWPEDAPRVREIPVYRNEDDEDDAYRSFGDSLPAPGHFSDANDKLDTSILSYDMSPIVACPGCEHALCSELRPDGGDDVPPKPICFGCRGRYRQKNMKERLEKNFLCSQHPVFVPWANYTLSHRRRTIQAVRIPGIGDMYNEEFIRKVREVVAHTELPFWCYTRVWCVPKLWDEVLRQLKGLPNLSMWLSWDHVMAANYGEPPDRDLPWAWLADGDEDVPPARVDLVFRYNDFVQWNRKPPVKLTIAGCLVCPHENGAIEKPTCSQCGICWSGTKFRKKRIAQLLRKATEVNGSD